MGLPVPPPNKFHAFLSLLLFPDHGKKNSASSTSVSHTSRFLVVARATYPYIKASSTNPESNYTSPTPPATPVAVPTTYAYDGNGNLVTKTAPVICPLAPRTGSYDIRNS
jgi:hypothetical protein